MLGFFRKLGVAVAIGTANAALRAVAGNPATVAVTRSRASGRKPSRILLVPAAAAACTGLIGGFEALRTTAYRDIVGIPPICWGETQCVRMGDIKTVADCNSIFARRLDEFAPPRRALRPVGGLDAGRAVRRPREPRLQHWLGRLLFVERRPPPKRRRRARGLRCLRGLHRGGQAVRPRRAPGGSGPGVCGKPEGLLGGVRGARRRRHVPRD
jgi:hypothetical protein